MVMVYLKVLIGGIVGFQLIMEVVHLTLERLKVKEIFYLLVDKMVLEYLNLLISVRVGNC